MKLCLFAENGESISVLAVCVGTTLESILETALDYESGGQWDSFGKTSVAQKSGKIVPLITSTPLFI
jgi:hypothetical protein